MEIEPFLFCLFLPGMWDAFYSSGGLDYTNWQIIDLKLEALLVQEKQTHRIIVIGSWTTRQSTVRVRRYRHTGEAREK